MPRPVQVISLLASLKEAQGDALRPFLIVAPASVISSWQRELATWTPDLRVATYRGGKEAREYVFNSRVSRAVVGYSSSGGRWQLLPQVLMLTRAFSASVQYYA